MRGVVSPYPRRRLVGPCPRLTRRADPAGATKYTPVLEAPESDMCPGGLATTDAQ